MSRANLVVRSFVAGVFCFAFAGPALAQSATPTPESSRAIPADNLAYPVLIEIPLGDGLVDSGSGFYLNTATSTYLVTARHVLFDDKGKLLGPKMTLLSYPVDPNDQGLNVLSIDLAALSSTGDVIPSQTEDVAVVRIFTFQTAQSTAEQLKHAAMSPLPGVTGVKVAPSGFIVTPISIIKKYADVLVGNDIVVYGYPTSIGLKQIPQLDPNRPLLRQGIVAGLNPAAQTIVNDCFIYPGNSGGPVVELDRTPFQTFFKLIGVVIQYVPFAKGNQALFTLDNSGYAIVAPMDGVLALLK